MNKLIIGITLLAIGYKWWGLYDSKNLHLSDPIVFTPISKQQAQRLFEELQNLPFIEFDYTNNYCEDRAHAMAMYIDAQNIATAKVWIFVKGVFYNKFPKVLKVKDHNRINKKGYLGWKYHVAPVVLVENEGQLDTLVLDPSLTKTPVTIAAWQAMMDYKKDVPQTEVFWMLKDWRFHMYRVWHKKALLLDTWTIDKNAYLTKKGLCQGKILYDYLQVYADSTEARRKARKFKLIPKSYKKQLKPCMEALEINFE